MIPISGLSMPFSLAKLDRLNLFQVIIAQTEFSVRTIGHHNHMHKQTDMDDWTVTASGSARRHKLYFPALINSGVLCNYTYRRGWAGQRIAMALNE